MLFLRKNNKETSTDLALVHRYKISGEISYLAELFQRYTHLIFGVSLSYLKDEEDSKDAVMEIFEHLLQVIDQHEVANFKNWLYSVTKNHCLMKLRKQKKLIFTPMDVIDLEKILSMEKQYDSHLMNGDDQEEQIQYLEIALQQLEETQRICIEMFYRQGKSYKEITQITGYTLNQVKSYIQNGKRNLKNFIVNLRN